MYASATLELFSAPHLTVLALVAAVTAALCALLRRARRSPDRAAAGRTRWGACVGAAGVMLAGSIFAQVHLAATGRWSAADSLPLHVCDLAVYITAGALVLAGHAGLRADRRPVWAPGAGQLLYEIAYFWGLGGTVQALLTPDVDAPFPAVTWLRYFLTHGGIVAGVLALTFGLGMRPERGSWKRVWLITLATAIAMLGMNHVLGSNYMYLRAKPANVTIIDYLGPWPWYLLSLVALGTGLILLLYAPWWLGRRWRGARDA